MQRKDFVDDDGTVRCGKRRWCRRGRTASEWAYASEWCIGVGVGVGDRRGSRGWNWVRCAFGWCRHDPPVSRAIRNPRNPGAIIAVWRNPPDPQRCIQSYRGRVRGTSVSHSSQSQEVLYYFRRPSIRRAEWKCRARYRNRYLLVRCRCRVARSLSMRERCGWCCTTLPNSLQWRNAERCSLITTKPPVHGEWRRVLAAVELV